jgi:hypothetical protein
MPAGRRPSAVGPERAAVAADDAVVADVADAVLVEVPLERDVADLHVHRRAGLVGVGVVLRRLAGAEVARVADAVLVRVAHVALLSHAGAQVVDVAVPVLVHVLLVRVEEVGRVVAGELDAVLLLVLLRLRAVDREVVVEVGLLRLAALLDLAGLPSSGGIEVTSGMPHASQNAVL